MRTKKLHHRWTAPAATLAVLAALLLSGCGSGPSANGAGTGSGTTLNESTVLENPKSHTGPSTAHLAAAAIDPVAKAPTTTLPVTVTDAQGTNVTITDVSRILPIDLYGTSSRIVFDLGLGANVVGRDTSSTFPEIATLPLVTHNGHELNAEAILELAPTLIITDSSLGPWDVVLQMREAGIPVFVVDSHRSIDTAAAMISSIASALGVPDEGAELADRTTAEIEKTAAEIKAIAPSGSERLRMLFLYARGQSGVYYLFGEGSGADSLITGLGGIDVASEIGWKGMRPMTDEAMVEAAPDLVIMMSGGLESTNGVEGLLASVPALAHTPAGEKRRIVDMADADVLGFGPTSAAVLEALSVAIYAPEQAGS